MMRDLVLAEPKAQHATETQLVNLLHFSVQFAFKSRDWT